MPSSCAARLLLPACSNNARRAASSRVLSPSPSSSAPRCASTNPWTRLSVASWASRPSSPVSLSRTTCSRGEAGRVGAVTERRRASNPALAAARASRKAGPSCPKSASCAERPRTANPAGPSRRCTSAASATTVASRSLLAGPAIRASTPLGVCLASTPSRRVWAAASSSAGTAGSTDEVTSETAHRFRRAVGTPAACVRRCASASSVNQPAARSSSNRAWAVCSRSAPSDCSRRPSASASAPRRSASCCKPVAGCCGGASRISRPNAAPPTATGSTSQPSGPQRPSTGPVARRERRSQSCSAADRAWAGAALASTRWCRLSNTVGSSAVSATWSSTYCTGTALVPSRANSACSRSETRSSAYEPDTILACTLSVMATNGTSTARATSGRPARSAAFTNAAGRPDHRSPS